MANTPVELNTGRSQRSFKNEKQNLKQGRLQHQRASSSTRRLKTSVALRSQTGPECRGGKKTRKQTKTAAAGRRRVLGPVSARLLTAAACFQLPPSLGRDWLSLFQGRGCRAAAAAKSQPDWLMLFIKEPMREWAWGGGPLCCCALCRISARYLTPIYSYSDMLLPGAGRREGFFFFLSASAAWQVEGAVISDWTQMRSLRVEADVVECLNKPAIKSS